jgi:hypothetical protein
VARGCVRGSLVETAEPGEPLGSSSSGCSLTVLGHEASVPRVAAPQEPFRFKAEPMLEESNRPFLPLLALGALLCFGCASNPPPEAGGPPTEQHATSAAAQRPAPQIPPEAFEACNGKQVGDQCVTILEDQATEGQCASPPPDVDDPRLMCGTKRSSGPRHEPPDNGQRREPPPGAIEACGGKQAGDSCTVDIQGRTMTGECARPPAGAQDQALSCRPSGPPGPGPDVGTRQAL